MSKKQPKHSEAIPTAYDATNRHQKQPAGSAACAGLAGITAETAERVFSVAATHQPPLPGFEAVFPPSPLELDNSSESLTNNYFSLLSPELEPLRNDYKRLGLPESHHRDILRQWEDDNGMGVGACMNYFPSGEVTGGCYSLGRRNRSGGRNGKIVSHQFTKQAKKTIRRAVQCNPDEFKLFVTLTFDPKLSVLNEAGQVEQAWAKKEFTRFLNSVKKKYDRMSEKTGKGQWQLHYIWVAEIQELNTKNIHFHILFNRSFMPASTMVQLWGQAANSVNVKRLKNPDHAVNYMLKYMSKGSSPIEGKRYGMTKKLLERSQPTRVRFEGRAKRKAFLGVMRDSFTDIKDSGGFAMDWGFAIPPVNRKRSKGGEGAASSKKLAYDFLQRINAAVAEVDVTNERLNACDEMERERTAIMECASGQYDGAAARFEFGGDE